MFFFYIINVKKISYIFILFLLSAACTTGKKIQKPTWVAQRPVNEAFYVGVGIASKLTNPQNYQQAAKKEALNDLISEIKVTVSSNSVLQQMQNNAEFKQQFESQVKITALNEIENFEVVGSWENEQYFWIYMRLSKTHYAEMRRKRMQSALERAIDFWNRAGELDEQQNYSQVLRMKLKALATVQEYLNEDLQTIHNGRTVYLVNEILSSLQAQLYRASVRATVAMLYGKVGKPIQHPFDVMVYLSDTTKGKISVPFLPMQMVVEQGKMEYGAQTQTDQNGIASFTVARILARDPVQLIRLSIHLNDLLKTDSLNFALKNVLINLDPPSTTIRVFVAPIKIYIETQEQNLSQSLVSHPLETFFKKNLVAVGCNFVSNKLEADYILKVKANTSALGTIWGNMQSASLNLSISLVDNKNNAEIFKDGYPEIKGFQTTPENAGLDAYKTAEQHLLKNSIPKLVDELMKIEQP